MTFRLRSLGAVAVVLSLGCSLQAATITLASDGNNPDQTNNSASLGLLLGDNDTKSIAGHPAWAAPLAGSSWVSFGETGDFRLPGWFEPQNNIIVSFFDVFNLTGIPVGGSVTVRADDSAGIYLNGTLISTEATTFGNNYRTCSDFGLGCLESTQLLVNLPSNLLVNGLNTLRFDVAQRGGASYGVNYQGTVTYHTPEPATFALIGVGLAALAIVRRKLA